MEGNTGTSNTSFSIRSPVLHQEAVLRRGRVQLIRKTVFALCQAKGAEPGEHVAAARAAQYREHKNQQTVTFCVGLVVRQAEQREQAQYPIRNGF